jgi:hypothetical protein
MIEIKEGSFIKNKLKMDPPIIKEDIVKRTNTLLSLFPIFARKILNTLPPKCPAIINVNMLVSTIFFEQ